MESILNNYLIPYWSFLAVSGISVVLLQVLKGAVWTKANCSREGKVAKIYFLGRQTLPLQPVLLGIILGAVPGVPVPDFVGDAVSAQILYFSLAGVSATWLFSVIKSLAKKQGIDLSIATTEGTESESDTIESDKP